MVIRDNDVRIKVWNRRVVRLSLAGYVMKGVTVFAMKFGAVDNADEDVESIAKDAFEGEGEV
ncbi:unnamed protein product [Coffea canephora]|uniref:Uncharacterized protein n=1 Tax=Coffea canephora TaxID=49390 RepID=A0A068TT93_COFCA|nr:unnamed protein product [Coffea canephora]